MDKAILTFAILALVDTVREFVPSIDGKAVVRLVALASGALVGAGEALVESTDLKTGVIAGVACAVAAIGGVALMDRHADRSAANG